MIKEIPIPEGKKIIGYNVLHTLDEIDCYIPIYSSIYTERTVYTDSLKMYVYIDTCFINVFGEKEKPKNLTEVTREASKSFYEQLKNNGYFISSDNKLVRGYWFPEYNHNCGFYPCFASGETASYGLEANDKFHETFQFRSACVMRCNMINKFLHRGYAEQV